MAERSKVIDALNGLITTEMGAINQYFVHAKIQSWPRTGRPQAA